MFFGLAILTLRVYLASHDAMSLLMHVDRLILCSLMSLDVNMIMNLQLRQLSPIFMSLIMTLKQTIAL